MLIIVLGLLISYCISGWAMVASDKTSGDPDAPAYIYGSFLQRVAAGSVWPYIHWRNRNLSANICSYLGSSAVSIGLLAVLVPHVSYFWATIIVGLIRLIPLIGWIFTMAGFFISLALMIVIGRLSQGKSHSHAANPNQGVHGWLKVFCAVLIVVAPLRNLAEIRSSLASSTGLTTTPGGTLIYPLVLLLISAFSIYAGVGLWRVSPGAVRRAKTFLWALLVLNLIGLANVLAANTLDTGTTLSHTLQGLAFPVFWLFYLASSQRVHNTYAAVSDPPPLLHTHSDSESSPRSPS